MTIFSFFRHNCYREKNKSLHFTSRLSSYQEARSRKGRDKTVNMLIDSIKLDEKQKRTEKTWKTRTSSERATSFLHFCFYWSWKSCKGWCSKTGSLAFGFIVSRSRKVTSRWQTRCLKARDRRNFDEDKKKTTNVWVCSDFSKKIYATAFPLDSPFD